jgi:hypothetical protein
MAMSSGDKCDDVYIRALDAALHEVLGLVLGLGTDDAEIRTSFI